MLGKGECKKFKGLRIETKEVSLDVFPPHGFTLVRHKKKEKKFELVNHSRVVSLKRLT